MELIFYSEGAHYWNLFLPIIEEFEKRKIHSIYWTSKENDLGLESNFSYMEAKFIGDGIKAFTLLNRIKVKIVLMTTPQLDIMHLKRSKDVEYYGHIIHAPTDALLYKKFAFDYFDFIMCSGKHQIESIRALEKKRELPEKTLYKTGLTYYDVMLRDKNKHSKRDNNTILVAPAWGNISMLVKFGAKPIKELLNAGYNVILRPHPQMFVSQKELLDEILNEISSYSNFTLDKDPSPQESMGIATILVSDFSGIIFDFFFMYEKPVVVIESDIDIGGFEAEDVEHNVWEIEMLDKVATIIKEDEIKNIASIIKNMLKKDISKEIIKLRDDSIFNFGNASRVAVEQIVEIRGR
jgi:hypothetical protein